MSEQQIDDGLEWLGQYAAFQDRAGQKVPGMRAGISLTAVRGTSPEEWLARLGADRVAVDSAVPYRQFELSASADPVSVCMFDTCGEWTFVLEDELAATWFLAQFDNPAVAPGEDEELVCVSLNHHNAPGLVAYSPRGAKDVWTAEFGKGLLEDLFVQPEDPSGRLAAFDEALARAGAVHSRLDPPKPWQELRDTDWARAVYRAVGDHFGIAVDRGQVEQGLLPAVALPLPQ